MAVNSQQLSALLCSLLPDYQCISASPLSGGLSNRCWQVDLQHIRSLKRHRFVWRPVSLSTAAFDISRDHEYQLLAGINRSDTGGIAPRPFLCHEQGILVEWLEGDTANAELDCEALLKLQAQIHQLPVPKARLDVQQKSAHYWHHISIENKDESLRAIYGYFQALKPVQWFSDTCCHHDLGWYNVIVSPQDECRVIDWEYAAAGDPSLDLALTLSANQLPITEAVEQYCHIRQCTDIERWCQAVQSWLPWCEYLAMLWFYVGAELWQDESYLIEAEKLKRRLISYMQSID
ncbi:phosphotransferase [Photobacterium sanctipauli]|uniref:Phosphotransferase n=1 Tax=Photobacterium sanctipauli TaxID=1342794 RepID=A0A2T3NY17_9GAMM|nr:phosphotransferase [Photobacterium sanctipauli]PSW21132.1 phosphotransferase [Photobacterium sanctipauli]